MPKFFRLCVILCLVSGGLSATSPQAIHVDPENLVGEARFNYMLWPVYDISLYAPQGDFTGEPPFSLKIVYLRQIAGERIASQSVALIRDQGFDDEIRLAGWYQQMKNIFPDVDKGSELTGVHAVNGESIFYRQDREIGRIIDPIFGQYFFNIWLGNDTSFSSIRNQLVGANADG